MQLRKVGRPSDVLSYRGLGPREIQSQKASENGTRGTSYPIRGHSAADPQVHGFAVTCDGVGQPYVKTQDPLPE
jgi:hypothetical protein